MKSDKENLLLYAVTDRHWTGRETLRQQVEAALRGGVTFVQLREKNMEHDAFRKEALEIRDLCRAYRVPFVLDDDVSLAMEVDADGIHVGQSDMEAGDVRALIGPDRILGVSACTVEEAVAAEQRGADYLGVGAVFPTGSKDDARPVTRETLRKICEAVTIPVIAIGGITEQNVMELAGSGICGVAVISAIFGQPEIESATKRLKAAVSEMVSR
ncbi:thiamine phosphate synthase [Hornefia butyriciproducens]|uniref:Thiamine-phosphate synthase n=2 Tax=Hornefia butyriciproducens TaxID=2652293 RepID=A0A6L5Y4M0_9FIRM|nr:thiamine phosphate synthase [Hornefia butyriciproducens]MCI7326964.1 thiamine phosphate synthase [Clostridiales bacterium]MCI7413814.1 thiamine phosphate synthase [Clostridiales bacterium]MCI7679348.1 thiamine phosphate synthase [Clostridiales bacterium]MDD7020911.1 thiamine phosphate synthase [Hornefia butyriciproducens]MDY2991156.1 thiamine phosphate synthase [Hornefia butyriciproducens]